MCPANQQDWPYPGSRWWKFDFHTHTPASLDTYWARHDAELQPIDWLLRFMAAEIDCVAVTDHNSGAWIDPLKTAYKRMKEDADAGSPCEGFRELTLFPGVEISVAGGFHLLAIFDPSATTRTVTDLLAKVGCRAPDGDSDGVTTLGPAGTVHAVADAGGIAIPAHADGPKGLLQLGDGRESNLDANTVRDVLNVGAVLAMEWCQPTVDKPSIYLEHSAEWAEVLGSDCHNFRGDRTPGSAYTWVKMAHPNLEGLRLALLDGQQFSLRRSDEEAFEPFRTPENFITRVEIDSARYMGRDGAEKVSFTPYYNALIGGRGTGKSSVVHALRLAYAREEELRELGETAEPCRQFDSFAKVAQGRDSDGALRADTEVRVELMRDGVPHVIRRRFNSQETVVEQQDAAGTWHTSGSQEVNPQRFPIRLFSQGQIAAMAGERGQALLRVIDEAAGVPDLRRALREATQVYQTQRARLRELDGRLTERAELERRLEDLKRKLDTFEQSDYADVLKAHQRALRQRSEVDASLEKIQAVPDNVRSLMQDFVLTDWPKETFESPNDDDILAWRNDAEKTLANARDALEQAARAIESTSAELEKDERLDAWRRRADQAKTEYESLQKTLEAEGVEDPEAFGRLAQERQEVEAKLQALDELQHERQQLQSHNENQWQKIVEARSAITDARDRFLKQILNDNSFVHMEVVPFGFDPQSIERDLRRVLEVEDGRFDRDILSFDGNQPVGGIAHELAEAGGDREVLERVKCRLIQTDGLGGHFRNHLQRKLENPEFSDRIRCWFPEDDLRIRYSPRGNGRDWRPIRQGSQGQRSAALLAFLLAFGDEPLVLDQPEDDLDNHLIYRLIVRQIRESKLRRQIVIVTHNPNVVVNGDAEMVQAFNFSGGQCRITQDGALQEQELRDEVCEIMEGGHEAFRRRWDRLGRET